MANTSNTNIAIMLASIPNLKHDFKHDWKETSKHDWVTDWLAAAPTNSVLPAITGAALVGQVLTVSNGTWAGRALPTFTYQWLLAGIPIVGATAKAYTIVSGNVGSVIACNVIATNTSGSVTRTSAATATVS